MIRPRDGPRFQRSKGKWLVSWGVAPGWNKSAPLALNRYRAMLGAPVRGKTPTRGGCEDSAMPRWGRGAFRTGDRGRRPLTRSCPRLISCGVPAGRGVCFGELQTAFDGVETLSGFVGARLGEEGVVEVFPKFPMPAQVDDDCRLCAARINHECNATHAPNHCGLQHRGQREFSPSQDPSRNEANAGDRSAAFRPQKRPPAAKVPNNPNAYFHSLSSGSKKESGNLRTLFSIPASAA